MFIGRRNFASPETLGVILALFIGLSQSGSAQLTRVENTTMTLPADAGGDSYDYTTEDTFSPLTFSDPVAFATPPGQTNQLYIVERPGRIQVITNLASPTKSLFMDINGLVTGGTSGNDERGLLGLAFHPDYQSNGYFYVFYTGQDSTAGSGLHDIISRFQVDGGNPYLGDTNSEVRLIRQRDQASNHNGGDLHFGPDGYLYISLGDEGGADDSEHNAQTITKDFFSAIARIDVDMGTNSVAPNPHPSNSGVTTNYSIPPDNPYISVTNFHGTNLVSTAIRTEFYAIGQRNPWRMAFDEINGRLYCGDVGQSAREEVNIIEPGGNYGWAFREGTINGPRPIPSGMTNEVLPILEYAHGSGTNQGFVISGGRVYYGDRFPELVGRYVFADFGSDNIWALYYDGTNTTEWFRLTGDSGIAAFGKDPRNGDLLLADLEEDKIKRLVRNTNTTTTTLPLTLDDTGIFSDLSALTPHPGIEPFDINLPFWSDNAIKSRWFSVPNTNLTIDFNAVDPWIFPTGTVWIKHFELELTNGVPSSARRIETRVVVRNDGGVYGATYRWGNSTTNAVLVPEEGLNEDIVIYDSGIIRTQTWRYPSRSECLSCHKSQAGFTLGFNTLQLNKDFVHGSVTANQIQALSDAGYFNSPVSSVRSLDRLARPEEDAYSVEYRARSWIQANCSQCHFPGPTLWDARLNTKLSQANIVNGFVFDNLGNGANRVIRPGNEARSVLLSRISTRGGIQMPPIATSIVDTQGVALVAQWIAELTEYLSFADYQILHFGSTNTPDAQAGADPDDDSGDNELEWLTGTDPTNSIPDSWGIDIAMDSGNAQIFFERIKNRGFVAEYSTNLLSQSWVELDVPENTPFYSSSNFVDSIADTDTNAVLKFYRIGVYEK